MLIDVPRRVSAKTAHAKWQKRCDGYEATVAKMQLLFGDETKGEWAESMAAHYSKVLEEELAKEPTP